MLSHWIYFSERERIEIARQLINKHESCSQKFQQLDEKMSRTESGKCRTEKRKSETAIQWNN